MKRILTSLMIMTLLLPLLQGCTTIKHIKQKYFPEKRPNFLVIVTDDQRFDTMQYMPETKKVIFDQGVTFMHGYITTPLCCPSRVSILTGAYAHNSGVRENPDKFFKPTVIQDLHNHGYYTGLVGKYLNSWNGDPKPEYDYWASYFRGESPYYNPVLNVNGHWFTNLGYITDILGTYSMQFVKEAISSNKPWILLYAPIAPHAPTEPYIGDLGLYPNLEPFRPPSFNEVDVSDKPTWLQNRNPLSEAEIAGIDKFRRSQILTLVSLDRAIGALLNSLKEQGQLDNTFIIFLSDNGKFWGEHRITSKNSFYEEAIKVPFAVRYPPLTPKPYVDEHLVANIDIAPTIYELAGIKPTGLKMDGMSLVGLLNKTVLWRDSLLFEGWPPRGIYSAIHTDRYVYAETQGDRNELYDLQNDPYQLTNIADDPAYQDIIKELKAKLDKVREPASAPTPIPDDSESGTP